MLLPSHRPAMFRQIDGIAVRIKNAVLGLAVRRTLVEVGLIVECLANLADGSDIVHLEAEMIDAHSQLRPFDLALRPDRYDRQVNMTIGKISRRSYAVNDLQSECRGVELHQLLPVLGENSERTNASHRIPPLR